MLIAQITDLHVRAKHDVLHAMVHTSAELKRCVRMLEELIPRPRFVVATGDLTDRGKRREYRRLRAILSGLGIPVYLLPGNHDDRDALREVFGHHEYLPRSGPLSYVVESRPLRLIALDTTKPGKAHGFATAAALEWLEARLCEGPQVPTMVAMHHPPFDLGIPAIDRKPMRGRAALEALVARHPQIVRIVCGHVHQVAEKRFGGTIASTAPSTAHQLVVGADANGAHVVRVQRPGLVLHRWSGERLLSSVVRTDDPSASRLHVAGSPVRSHLHADAVTLGAWTGDRASR